MSFYSDLDFPNKYKGNTIPILFHYNDFNIKGKRKLTENIRNDTNRDLFILDNESFQKGDSIYLLKIFNLLNKAFESDIQTDESIMLAWGLDDVDFEKRFDQKLILNMNWYCETDKKEFDKILFVTRDNNNYYSAIINCKDEIYLTFEKFLKDSEVESENILSLLLSRKESMLNENRIYLQSNPKKFSVGKMVFD